MKVPVMREHLAIVIVLCVVLVSVLNLNYTKSLNLLRAHCAIISMRSGEIARPKLKNIPYDPEEQ